MQLEFIETILGYQHLQRSMDFWLKSIFHYRFGGYLQLLLMLYILYSAILQYLFFLMAWTDEGIYDGGICAVDTVCLSLSKDATAALNSTYIQEL
jgi:hypothetical protein